MMSQYIVLKLLINLSTVLSALSFYNIVNLFNWISTLLDSVDTQKQDITWENVLPVLSAFKKCFACTQVNQRNNSNNKISCFQDYFHHVIFFLLSVELISEVIFLPVIQLSARHFRHWRLIFESDEYPIRHLNFQKIIEKCL